MNTDPRFDMHYAHEWMGVPPDTKGPDAAARPTYTAPKPRRKPWTYERPVYEHDRVQSMDGFGHPT